MADKDKKKLKGLEGKIKLLAGDMVILEHPRETKNEL